MPDIEEHIRRAMEEGKFDELAGKGKPLPLDENPLEHPEWRLAYRMLRSSGYSLPWIELRKEIETEIEAARTSLKRAWEWRRSALPQNRPSHEVEADWKEAMGTYRKQVEAINKKIVNYNLQAPSERLHMMKLNVERDVRLITGQ